MRIAVCFIVVFASFVVNAQEYHVVNVKGNVSVSGKQGKLKANDKLKADDKLVFSSKTDAIAVVNPKAGRFVISPAAQKKDGELMAYVRDAITPGTKKLSTRSGLFNNALDFSQYFKDTVLLLPVMRYRTSYLQDEKNFLFIRFNHHGEEISKKLKTSGDTLIINRDELYSIDKKSVDASEISNMRLLYLQGSEIHTLSNLHFNSPKDAELIEGVKILKQLYPAKDIREETMDYLTELYGKIDETNFDRWYKTIN